MSAHDLILDALKRNGSTVNERGDRAMAQCPAHDDRNPSLSVGQRSDGKGTVVKCFAGCDTADVLAKLGLTMADLFDDAAMRDVWNPTRTYLYSDGRTVKRGLKSNGSKDFWQTGNRDGNALFHAERTATPPWCSSARARRMSRRSRHTAVSPCARRWAPAMRARPIGRH